MVAHPFQYGYDEAELLAYIDTALAAGCAGVEAYYSEHSPEDERWLLARAEEYGLGVSGGSDYHGTRKTHIAMGRGMGNLAIPRRVLDELKKLR